MENREIIIVGAGPGGAATALKLDRMGVKCTIIDKAIFPREKVCGDGLSAKVVTIFERIDPKILERFASKEYTHPSWGIRFVAPNNKALRIPFKFNYNTEKTKAPGYVCRRIDFDNFLVDEIKASENIELIEDLEITSYNKTNSGWESSNSKKNIKFNAKLLIVANGAYSSFSRNIAGFKMEPHHYCAGVRTYYKGVENLDPENYIELHFIKNFLPGYFWIFPLPNGLANVGAGMLSRTIKNKNINLRESMLKIIEEHPEISKRFKNAKQIENIKGYGLPLASKKRRLSGDNYILVGDAGHLIDPFSGEGIGNAIYSGYIAAEQAIKCFEINDFSSAEMINYDIRIQRVFGTEFKISYSFQKLLRYPTLFNAFANFVVRNKRFTDSLSRIFLDLDYRKKIKNPIFLLKQLFRINN